MRDKGLSIIASRICFLNGILAVFASQNIFANNGLMLPANGPTAWGMGGASIAYPKDSMAGANNPAGIALVGDRIDTGVSIIYSPLRAHVGSNSYKDNVLVPIPEAGISKALSNVVSIGMTMTSQGLQLNYKEPVLGTKDLRNKLTQIVLAPTATWQFKPGQYIGFSPRIAYQRLDIAGLEGIGASYNGADSGYGAGFSIGYLGEITRDFKIGITYSSPIWFQKLKRYSNLLPDALNLPQQAGIGASYQINQNLAVAVDALWINWSGERAYGNTMNEGGALGESNGPSYGWRDQYVYRLGFDYKLSQDWSFRTGFSLASKLISDNEVLLGVLAPLTQYNHYSVGVSYNISKELEVSSSYIHAFSNETTGSGGSAGARISGGIDYFNVGLSYKY